MSSTEVSNMSVSKDRSLRTLPPTYNISLVFSHGKKYRDQTFCTLSDDSYHVRSVPEMRGMYFITSCYGWLMLESMYSPECYLFNPVSLIKIHLPPLPVSHRFNEVVLTSSPTDPSSVVMLFDSGKKSLFFCRIGGTKWVEQSLRPMVSEGDISAISCNGKIYLFFSEVMAVIHDIYDTFVSMELHDVKVPEYTRSRGSILTSTLSYLVESRGEIFQIRFRTEYYIFQTLDVFKLDLSRMSWVKVESLGDRIFLLGENSTSISATEVGLKENCIYFSCPGSTRLCKFEMDDGTITITNPGPKKFPYWRGPFWMVPDCRLQVKKDITNMKDPKDEGNQERSWKDLLPELLDLIFSSLSLGDCIRFRLTCKSWMSITRPVLQSNSLYIPLESGFHLLPWLMCFPKRNHGVCKFHHPIYSDGYTVDIPELAGAIIRNARYGWLLISRGDTCIFFFNPFTMEIINLPDFDKKEYIQSMSFSSPPASPDCIVIALSVFDMLVYRKSENTWCKYFLGRDLPFEFILSACNPVFYGGIFYFLCKDGKLGLFNPNSIKEDEMLVFQESKVFSISSPESDSMMSIRSYIVESDGEILSVFVGDQQGKPVSIFKLDKLKMRWNQMETISDKVLFLSHTASVVIPAPLKGIENRIYFPRFQGKDNIFYSLLTCNYHWFGCSNNSAEDWLNTAEHMDCTWI